MAPPTHDQMFRAVVDGDIEEARRLATEVVSGQCDALSAVEHGFAAGIRRVGELWDEGEYFLPELVQGAEAMKAAMGVLGPALGRAGTGGPSKGSIVIGTVKGDLHDIGKTLVATLLAAHGFQVHDLGSDVPVEVFVAKAREVGARVVAASALLTTTMPVQRELVRAIADAGLSDSVRVLVGGCSTTPAWAAEIGAAHAENAMRAVAVAESLVA